MGGLGIHELGWSRGDWIEMSPEDVAIVQSRGRRTRTKAMKLQRQTGDRRGQMLSGFVLYREPCGG